MENYSNQVQETLNVLKTSYSAIEKILSDENVVHLKNRLLRVIDKEITSLSIQHGFDYEAKYSEPVIGEPLTRVMGRDVTVKGAPVQKQLLTGKPVQEKAIAQSAQEVEAAEFNEKTLELYAIFPTIENEAILDQFEDMVIRGVGKIAGLPVTENHPKKVNVKFVEEIKDAIQKKNELENASNLNDPNITPSTSTLAEQLSGEDKSIKKASVDGLVNDLNQKKSDKPAK